jgi:hypothetical protein
VTDRTGPVKVLSVVGPGRSGSTLLAGVLAELPGFATMGELRWLWQRGLTEGRSCGCGRQPRECPVWSEALTAAIGPPGTPDESRTVERMRRQAARSRGRRVRYSAVSAAGDVAAAGEELGHARRVTARVCGSLAEVTGASVLVDASKRAYDASVLSGSPDVDHYVVHLVRDPRAVAYSWGRAKARPDLAGPSAMATRSPVSSAVRWAESAWSAARLRRRLPAERWLSLRYEDFVADPERETLRLAAFVGADAPSPFTGPGTLTMHANHSVAGNPDRFRTGETRIRRDDEWLDRMRPRDRVVVTALTAPWLARYGYPVRTGGRRGGGSATASRDG